MVDINTPLVSVIVPIYNVEKYLEKCIVSIREQVYSNIEIILVDDGSIDDSSKICDDYEKLDERIRVIHKVNGGLSDARNAGIEICTGEYILFVDSDDYIHPNMIKGMIDVAKCDDVDIVECGIQYVDEYHNADFDIDEVPYNKQIFSHDEAIEKSLDYKLAIMAWNKLYKLSLFKQIRFPVGKLHEDEFVIPFVVDMCSKYALISNKYYAYVTRNNSIMNSTFSNKRLDIIEAYHERINYFNKKYEKKYDDIMKYHFFVACVNLKIIMKKQFYKSEVEDLYIKLFNQLAISRTLSLYKKFKIFVYRLIPTVILRNIRYGKKKFF